MHYCSSLTLYCGLSASHITRHVSELARLPFILQGQHKTFTTSDTMFIPPPVLAMATVRHSKRLVPRNSVASGAVANDMGTDCSARLAARADATSPARQVASPARQVALPNRQVATPARIGARAAVPSPAPQAALPARQVARAAAASPGNAAAAVEESEGVVAVVPADGVAIPPVNIIAVAAIALPPVGSHQEPASSEDDSETAANVAENNYKLKYGEDASTDESNSDAEMVEIPAVESVPHGA